MALPRDDAALFSRTPPQNVELEMCVLGGIMLEPKDAFTIVADYLSRDSFYLDGHALVFEIMSELHHRGIPPDSTSVLDELRARSLLDKVGGSGVLMGMLNSVPTAANVEYHARKVAEKAHFRALIRACTRIIEDCYMQEKPLSDVLDGAESAILRLSTRSAQDEFVPIHAILQEYWEKLSSRELELRERREQGETDPRITVGLETGFADLDHITGGLRASELTIIAARPSMGKTALGLNIAHHIAVERNIPVAVFSLEMGMEQLAERMLCMGTKHFQSNRIRGISTTMLQNPDLSDHQWSILTSAYQSLVSAPVFIDESSLLTVQMLKSKVRRLHAHQKVELIIVDYLQLMTGTSTNDNRVQEVSEISRGLKQIARELRIPVIALSQLSRAVETRSTKRPQLSDLRESGAIEQDADVVMFIHRDDYYQEKEARTANYSADYDEYSVPEAQIIVAKNRNGPTDTVRLRWFPEITRFFNSTHR